MWPPTPFHWAGSTVSSSLAALERSQQLRGRGFLVGRTLHYIGLDCTAAELLAPLGLTYCQDANEVHGQKTEGRISPPGARSALNCSTLSTVHSIGLRCLFSKLMKSSTSLSR